MKHKFSAWEVVQNPINKRTAVKTDEGFIDPCDGLAQEERDIARARLIAAAPDLYAALRAALQTYTPSFVNPGTGRHDPQELPPPDWVVQASVALAKVEA